MVSQFDLIFLVVSHLNCVMNITLIHLQCELDQNFLNMVTTWLEYAAFGLKKTTNCFSRNIFVTQPLALSAEKSIVSDSYV